MKSQSFPSLFNENLKLVSVCPLCNAAKESLNAQVVEENEDMHLMHMECIKCGNAIIALVVHGANGLNSVGMLTDLTYKDVVKFRSSASVEIDDSLAFYEAMQNQTQFKEYLVKS